MIELDSEAREAGTSQPRPPGEDGGAQQASAPVLSVQGLATHFFTHGGVDLFGTAGAVIDFIEPLFIDFAVFNIADAAICIGACITAVSVFITEHREEPGHGRASD